MQLTETTVAYFENHMKHINVLCRQNSEFFNVEENGTYTHTTSVL
jgi:hypothetical protein